MLLDKHEDQYEEEEVNELDIINPLGEKVELDMIYEEEGERTYRSEVSQQTEEKAGK